MISNNANLNANAVRALQSDLVSAIGSMDQALPIYDGFRARSMGHARRALMIVDNVISGGRSFNRPAISERDTIASKEAHSKYSVSQIAQSQTLMRSGLRYLNASLNDLRLATNGVLGKKGERCQAAIQTAIGDANTAIGLHANAG